MRRSVHEERSPREQEALFASIGNKISSRPGETVRGRTCQVQRSTGGRFLGIAAAGTAAETKVRLFCMLKIGFDDCCPYCGNFAVYRSRSETRFGRACWLLMLDLARCHGCMRQHYRLIFSPALEYPSRCPEGVYTDSYARTGSALTSDDSD